MSEQPDAAGSMDKREFDLRVREQSLRHGQRLGEHAREHQAELDAQHRQVTVWCYADPNSDRGTSTVTGTPDQVRGFCPDQRQPTYDPGGNP